MGQVKKKKLSKKEKKAMKKQKKKDKKAAKRANESASSDIEGVVDPDAPTHTLSLPSQEPGTEPPNTIELPSVEPLMPTEQAKEFIEEEFTDIDDAGEAKI